MKGGLLQRLRAVSRPDTSPERAQHTRALDPSNPFATPPTPPTVPATAESSPEEYTLAKAQTGDGSPTLETECPKRRYTTTHITEVQKKLEKYSQSIQASLREDDAEELVSNPTEDGWIDVRITKGHTETKADRKGEDSAVRPGQSNKTDTRTSASISVQNTKDSNTNAATIYPRLDKLLNAQSKSQIDLPRAAPKQNISDRPNIKPVSSGPSDPSDKDTNHTKGQTLASTNQLAASDKTKDASQHISNKELMETPQTDQQQETARDRIGKHIGPATYESLEAAYQLRPLPITNNDNAIFIDCAHVDLTTTALEIYEKEVDHIEAMDFHFGRKFIEIEVTSAEKRQYYITNGIRTTDKVWPCRASISECPKITWLHVDKVKLCSLEQSTIALRQAFSKIGTIVKIAPKLWEGLSIPSRSWLVVITDVTGDIPDSLLVDGVPVTVEKSGGAHVCRVCFSAEHKPGCPKNWETQPTKGSRQRPPNQQTNPTASYQGKHGMNKNKQRNQRPVPRKTTKEQQKEKQEKVVTNQKDLYASSEHKQNAHKDKEDPNPSNHKPMPNEASHNTTQGYLGQEVGKTTQNGTKRIANEGNNQETKNPVQRVRNEVQRRTSAPNLRAS